MSVRIRHARIMRSGWVMVIRMRCKPLKAFYGPSRFQRVSAVEDKGFGIVLVVDVDVERKTSSRDRWAD